MNDLQASFVIEVKSIKDLQSKLQDLIGLFEQPSSDLVIAKKLRITRRDMDALLGDYANSVHSGNWFAVRELIKQIAGELTLYDAPIDTWPAIAKAAQDAIKNKEIDEAFEVLAR
jgi:hypothetical protein